MGNIITFTDKDGDKIEFERYETDFIITTDNGHVYNSCVYLNPDQINQLITHLSTQLQSIGVEVDILKEK